MVGPWLFLVLAEDVRDVANQWKRDYNAGVGALDAGDAVGGLALAQKALAAAPEKEKNRVRALVADAGSKCGDRLAEFNALDLLAVDPKAEWQLFWNGSLDATADGYPASAYRYAVAAFERTRDKKAAAAILLAAAIPVGQLDRAMTVLPLLDPTEALGPKHQLVEVLLQDARCIDALKVVDEFAPQGEAYASLGQMVEPCRR
jgi:hypothetical protein